ncbi:NAD-dependent epimerase/dehydratase family protein [Actinacidiphila paucisporea]|uniref:NAD-dependent epimerase/dehydratase family protein n=1 Tax=Actinacidiphila paucisporea TaxID=310782 RepID=UPI000935E2BC|nr:NAD(P)-dependent oxidoreductase [Actinacidiphila paucisporea]
MKVLVTGAGGTLGREVVAHLRDEGWSVRAHDRTPPDPAVADEVLTGDLRDTGVLARAVHAVDAVVHAAALPSPTAAPEDEVFLNNVTASHLVLAGAARAGAGRLVNVSSLSALGFAFSRHGISPPGVPVTEELSFTGDDVYGLSKHVGEEIAARVSSRWGATAVSLRFPFIGTGDRLRRHLEEVHADPEVDRGSLWGWLDTRDAARAIGLALTAPLAGHTVVNVAAPDTTALEPTEDLVRRYHPGTRFDARLEGFAVPFTTRRSRELLGFTTRHAWRL